MLCVLNNCNFWCCHVDVRLLITFVFHPFLIVFICIWVCGVNHGVDLCFEELCDVDKRFANCFLLCVLYYHLVSWCHETEVVRYQMRRIHLVIKNSFWYVIEEYILFIPWSYETLRTRLVFDHQVDPSHLISNVLLLVSCSCFQSYNPNHGAYNTSMVAIPGYFAVMDHSS